MRKKTVIKLTTTPADAEKMAKSVARRNPGKRIVHRHETGNPGEKAQVIITEV